MVQKIRDILPNTIPKNVDEMTGHQMMKKLTQILNISASYCVLSWKLDQKFGVVVIAPNSHILMRFFRNHGS
jgi:hypothetical protein